MLFDLHPKEQPNSMYGKDDDLAKITDHLSQRIVIRPGTQQHVLQIPFQEPPQNGVFSHGLSALVVRFHIFFSHAIPYIHFMP
jgi:hypothetical protein